MTSSIDIEAAAEYLLNNRNQRNLVDNLPKHFDPQSADDAYRVQSQLVSRIARQHDATVCGYKLACTNAMAMDLLDVSGPFSGRLFSHSTHASGVSLGADSFVRRVVELEFVFVMGQDAPRSDTPYTSATIRPLIDHFMPGIEIVSHCFNDFTTVGGNALIADNAIHGASVIAQPVNSWKLIDLTQHKVNLIVNDQVFAQGSGKNVLGDPIIAMTWLANQLQTRGKYLKAGDIVTTGTACDVYNAIAGDQITADFAELGSVSVSFE